MSDKCEHNNHTHILLWVFVIASFMDCSGAQGSMKSDIWRQQQQINSLQREVSLCKK